MKNSLLKNTIYKSILSFINIVVPLIIGPYITRLLDVELYAVYNKNFSIFQVFLAFASFGIYNYGIREISKIRNDKGKVEQLFTNLFIISFLSNLVVLVFYIIYSLLTSSGITTSIFLVFTIQFLANIVYVEFVNEALENYKFITIKSVIVKLIYFIALLLFVVNPTDIILYAVIVSLTVLLNNIISFIYAKSKIKFNFSNIKIRKYLKALLSVLLICNIDLLYSQLDKIMLGQYVSSISVSLYFIPYYIVSTLVSIPYSIINVSIPRLSYIIKNKSKKEYEEKLNNSISSLLFLIIPICFGIIALAKEVIFIYAGPKYSLAVIPLIGACFIRIFICLESCMNNLVMYPNDKENQILKVTLCCGVLNLIMNYFLVLFKLFTPFSAMLTTGIAELVVFVWHYIYAKKKMNIDINVFSENNILYFALGLSFVPVALLIRTFNLSFMATLLLIILICSLLYFLVLYIKKDNNLLFIIEKIKLKLKGKRSKEV